MTERVIVVLVLGALASDCFAQGAGRSDAATPLIDPNQSSVYVKFRRVGKGPPLTEGETRDRIWLSLTNNTRWTISVSTFGLPDEYGTTEVGLMYEVEPYGARVPDGPVPTGTSFDVGSVTDVEPGKQLPFSVPRNHLDPGLAIRVDFTFKWERNNRYTHHSSVFSYWDLPSNLRDREKEQKLKQRYGPAGGGGPVEYQRAPTPSVLESPVAPRRPAK